MPDYTDLPDTAVGIGGIPSGTTVTALRDNPIAIAEGAVGAPKVQIGALGTSAVQSEETSNAGSGDETLGAFTGLDGRLVRCDLRGRNAGSGGTVNAEIRLSTDGGSTWTSWETLFVLSLDGITFHGYVNMDTGKLDFISSTGLIIDTTFSAAAYNAIQFRADGVSGTVAPRISAMVIPIMGATS